MSTISFIITYLLHPGIWLILTGIWICKKRHTSSGRRLLFLWGLAFYLSTTGWLIIPIQRYWENTYPTYAAVRSNDSIHVLVMGAGKNDDEGRSPIARLSPIALMRLTEGVRICLNNPKTTLICSGPLGQGTESQGELMRKAALVLGVPSDRIEVQSSGVNTHAEIESYVRRFGTSTPLVISTSALHMRRAMAWCQVYGISDVTGAPVDYRAPLQTIFQWTSLLPNFLYWEEWQELNKEMVGYLAIR